MAQNTKENLANGARLRNLGFYERFKLWNTAGLKVQEGWRRELTRAKKALREQKFSYLRGEIENPSKSIMLMLTQHENEVGLAPVPAIHDVNAYGADEPFDKFKNILKDGFNGGPYVNTYLLGPNPLDQFDKVAYDNNVTRDTHVVSTNQQSENDRYRLLMWSGFTENYNPKVDEGFDCNFANVKYCPPEDIEPFILLAKGLNESQIRDRIEYYNVKVSDTILPTRVKVLDAELQQVATIFGKIPEIYVI